MTTPKDFDSLVPCTHPGCRTRVMPGDYNDPADPMLCREHRLSPKAQDSLVDALRQALFQSRVDWQRMEAALDRRGEKKLRDRAFIAAEDAGRALMRAKWDTSAPTTESARPVGRADTPSPKAFDDALVRHIADAVVARWKTAGSARAFVDRMIDTIRSALASWIVASEVPHPAHPLPAGTAPQPEETND
jgi:hypothetical protein